MAWFALFSLLISSAIWYRDLVVAAFHGEFIPIASFKNPNTSIPGNTYHGTAGAEELGRRDSAHGLAAILKARESMLFGPGNALLGSYVDGYRKTQSLDGGVFDPELETLITHHFEDYEAKRDVMKHHYLSRLIETSRYRSRDLFDALYSAIESEGGHRAFGYVHYYRALLNTEIDGIEAPLLRIFPTRDQVALAVVLDYLQSRPDTLIGARERERLLSDDLRFDKENEYLSDLAGRYERRAEESRRMPKSEIGTASGAAPSLVPDGSPGPAATSYSLAWRNVSPKIWWGVTCLMLLLAFAVASSFLSGRKTTIALLGTWCLIPCVTAFMLLLTDVKLADFNWHHLLGLFSSLLPVGIWFALGLFLVFTSIGPVRVRKTFAKVYMTAGVGLPLIFGGMLLLFGLGS